MLLRDLISTQLHTFAKSNVEISVIHSVRGFQGKKYASNSNTDTDNNQKPEFGGPPTTPQETTTRYTTETTTTTTTTTTTKSTPTPTIPTSSSGTGTTPSFDYCEYGADGHVNKNPNQTITYDFETPAQGQGSIFKQEHLL